MFNSQEREKVPILDHHIFFAIDPCMDDQTNRPKKNSFIILMDYARFIASYRLEDGQLGYPGLGFPWNFWRFHRALKKALQAYATDRYIWVSDKDSQGVLNHDQICEACPNFQKNAPKAYRCRLEQLKTEDMEQEK